MSTNDTFEKLTLKAIGFVQKKYPDKLNGNLNKSLPDFINWYCIENGDKALQLKDTTFADMKDFVQYLESKDYIQLDSKKRKIASVLSTRYKKERKYIPPQRKVRVEKVAVEEKVEAPVEIEAKDVDDDDFQPPPSPPREIPMCPICYLQFDVNEVELTRHVEYCLTQQMMQEEQGKLKTSEPKPNFVVQQLPDDSVDECPICLEPLRKEQTVHRLECMCVYHSNCMNQWWRKSSECPMHPKDT